MEHIPHMVDMAMKPVEIENVKPINGADTPMPPMYPYGLCLSLNDETLDKLNMEDNCSVGDQVHFHCLAKVTSTTENEGSGKRIELQVIAMSAEGEEDEEQEEKKLAPYKKAYHTEE